MAVERDPSPADLKARRTSPDWQDRYQALEQARELPTASRIQVAELFLNDENAWVRSLAAQLAATPNSPARRSRRGIVREVDQILHGAQLSFDQRWRLIRLFEETEESGSTAQLGLAVDRASRVVTAALSEPRRADAHLRQLDLFLRHIAMYVRPVPVANESRRLTEVVESALSAFRIDASLKLDDSLSVRSEAVDRAIKELAQNALDAGSRRFEVEAAARNAHVVIQIKNDGPALRPTDVDALFRAWFTTRVGHAGLGLYLARAAVTEVGGNIVLTEASPVSFEISLPR